MRRLDPAGFTLIELMIVVAIIGILAAVTVQNYGRTVQKSKEGVTKGNLGMLRSAISIYASDNEGFFPTDNLASVAANSHYLTTMPLANTPPYHPETLIVTAEALPTDTGSWSYNNVSSDPAWGNIHVGCSHQDMRGINWSVY